MRAIINLIATLMEGDAFCRAHSGYFKVVTNPSRSTFLKRLKESGGCARGFLDLKSGEVHVWFEPALHQDVEADGEVWLTWNEPRTSDLRVQYDSESLKDGLGLRDDDDFDLVELLKSSKNFANVAANFCVVISQR